MNKTLLDQKLRTVEQQMQAKLEEIRVTFHHSGNKGSYIEISFRDFIREYLPCRLEVGHGEIFDTFDNISKQTDVIIINEDHPRTFTSGQPGIFFVEGVCAAGEVKTILTSDEFDSALKNSLAFKKLKISYARNDSISANDSDIQRFYKSPPWFLFAFESQLSLKTIKDKTEQFIIQEKAERTSLVDAVFILNKGWVINFGDGQGSFKFRFFSGELAQGWIESPSNTVLLDLLNWLLIVMPRVIRFEPILPQYTMRR